MNLGRAVLLAAFLIGHLACSVAHAADDEGGLWLGVRVPFGGTTPEPLRLSLAMAASHAEDGAAQSADIASLDFAARGKLIDGKVIGIPIMANGGLVSRAAEEPDDSTSKE